MNNLYLILYNLVLKSSFNNNQIFIYDCVTIRFLRIIMQLICSRHGITEHSLSSKKWKCKKCTSLYSKRYMQNLKNKIYAYAGNKCLYCGYDKCLRALHFHHIDPSTKDFSIFETRPGIRKTRNFELIKKEIDKCILLCANCHMELHDKDEKIIHEEIQIKLTKLDIEYLNKLIINSLINPEQALQKAIDIILKRHPKLSAKELRHQEWLKNNKIIDELF